MGLRNDQFNTPFLPNVESKEIVTSATDKLFAIKDLAIISIILIIITLIAFFTVAK
jgi:hypothetical protein